MLVKTIENKENGTKFEIYKNGENDYSYKYFEFYQSCGQRQIGKEEENYTKECIEEDFMTKVA